MQTADPSSEHGEAIADLEADPPADQLQPVVAVGRLALHQQDPLAGDKFGWALVLAGF
jgi:hypothetical protein